MTKKIEVCKISDIKEEDGFYEFRYTIIGLHGHFRGETLEIFPGFTGGDFFFADPIPKIGALKNVKYLTFLAIKVEPL
jgi:hypothetical protein